MKKMILSVAMLVGSINTYAFNMAYVEVNNNRLENARCYIDSQTKKPFFEMVSIFAPNINGDDPNQPTISLNPETKATMESGQIERLHQNGIKVLATILGNHQNAGWACMTDPEAAKAFADKVVAFVNKYHLDGIDIDDEWSRCDSNDFSMTMMAQAIKAHPGFKGKLLTKALFSDSWYFQSNYQGHRLSEYLDYGWEMSYGGSDFDWRLNTYKQNGMQNNHLMIGGWTNYSYPDPVEIGKYTANHKLAGAMVYDVTKNSLRYLNDLQRGLSGGNSGVEVLEDCLQ